LLVNVGIDLVLKMEESREWEYKNTLCIRYGTLTEWLGSGNAVDRIRQACVEREKEEQCIASN